MIKEHPDKDIFIRAIEGRLTEREKKAFYEHLIECEECRFKYSQLGLNLDRRIDSRLSAFLRFSFAVAAVVLFVLFGRFSGSIRSYEVHEIQIYEAGYADSSTHDSGGYIIEEIYVDTAILNLYRFRGGGQGSIKSGASMDDFIRIGGLLERDSF